jgi:hypothetical protein
MTTYNKNFRGSLTSNFFNPNKPFESKRECRNSKVKEPILDNADREYISSYGLLIVRHRERVEPYKLEKTKTNRLYYDYFEKHKDCAETKFYNDIKNPKILRYWKRYSSIGQKKKEWNFF